MSVGPVVAVLENVSLSYGRQPVVEGASFSLSAGEFVSLVGRNGSGKSTLMKGMLGLVPLLAGNIRIAGGNDAIGFLPQSQTMDEDFPATVWEVALSGCQRGDRAFFFHSREDVRLAEESLAAMGVLDLARRRIGTLSGGQRQRTFLARCLCRRPRLLLLDEPYSGLDPEAADSLSRMLTDLQTGRGLAVLMSTHDLEAVASSAGRVLVLDRRIQFDGKVGDWLNGVRKNK